MTTSDLRRGFRIELEGDPYVVVDLSTQSPSARGSTTLVKTKLRNLRTKQLVNHTFKAGERLKEPNFEFRNCQYLYRDSDGGYCFMDNETYDQFFINSEAIADEIGYLRENDAVKALFFDGDCIGIEVPPTVTLSVKECEPGVRGDTVTAATKNATLETGLAVQVPLFVNPGDNLVIDTRECRYIRRA